MKAITGKATDIRGDITIARTVGKLATLGPDLPATAKPPLLPDGARLAVEDGLRCLDCLTEQERIAIRDVACDWLSSALARARADWPAVVQHVDAKIEPGQVVLTSGLFGPSGTMVYAALRRRGATVVDFEHGVTMGISAHSERKLDFTEAASCDVLLCCSEAAAQAFSSARNVPVRRVEAIGLADQTRCLFRPRIQRLLSRRRLGLTGSQTTVLHVSTWPHYGNMRPGFGTPTETVVADTERTLVEEVYPKIPHRVVYKPYPTQRFPHEPPLESRLRLAPNLAFCPPEDLRYLRAAADVIVTGTPTSTLGWVVGAGVPVVWLASRRVFPLRDAACEAAFSEAFLTVDMDAADWRERLVALLSRSLDELQRDWRAREGARRPLLERAVIGPPGETGRRGANIVLSLIDTGSTR
jgi:hypothetical protein